MRTACRPAFGLLVLLAATLAPAAAAAPQGYCPASGDGMGASIVVVCVTSFEAGSGTPLGGGACVWIDENGHLGIDPDHPCSISGA
jgi:hypothetical protein